MSDEYRNFVMAALCISVSCESCCQREFDFVIHGTLICESCAAVA